MVLAEFKVDPTNFPPSSIYNIAKIVNLIIPLLMVGAGVLSFFMLILGAIKWVTSGSNPENLKKAQQTITLAAGGFIFVLLSYVFMKVIALVFKIPVPL